jgi:hypothetical protein
MRMDTDGRKLDPKLSRGSPASLTFEVEAEVL